jgi:DNA polymerase I-like protein with 3'-5' exonuclease and polymerase domains
MPDWNDPDRKSIVSGIERAAKNAGIQGSNADTIKQAMVYLVDRLEEGGYDAKLILTVHDEVVVECVEDQVSEVKDVVSKSLVDGFGKYFSTIPMEADSLVGPCWLKAECENEDLPDKCGGLEMDFDDNGVLRCLKCGKEQ